MEFASSKPVCTSPVEDIDTSAPPGGTTGQQLPQPRSVAPIRYVDGLHFDLICVHQVKNPYFKTLSRCYPFRSIYYVPNGMFSMHFLFTLFDAINVAIVLFDIKVFGWKLQ